MKHISLHGISLTFKPCSRTLTFIDMLLHTLLSPLPRSLHISGKIARNAPRCSFRYGHGLFVASEASSTHSCMRTYQTSWKWNALSFVSTTPLACSSGSYFKKSPFFCHLYLPTPKCRANWTGEEPTWDASHPTRFRCPCPSTKQHFSNIQPESQLHRVF